MKVKVIERTDNEIELKVETHIGFKELVIEKLEFGYSHRDFSNWEMTKQNHKDLESLVDKLGEELHGNYYSIEFVDKHEDDIEQQEKYIDLLEKIQAIEYRNENLLLENDKLCEKLADIRNLFDESDEIAQGHGMEDAISSPYAVACYAEDKLKRLIEENALLNKQVKK